GGDLPTVLDIDMWRGQRDVAGIAGRYTVSVHPARVDPVTVLDGDRIAGVEDDVAAIGQIVDVILRVVIAGAGADDDVDRVDIECARLAVVRPQIEVERSQTDDLPGRQFDEAAVAAGRRAGPDRDAAGEVEVAVGEDD